MSSIVLNGDTSGSVTVSAPAVAGTQTVNLPAASGQLMVSGNMPAFYVTLGSNQSISALTLTKLQFNTETFDTNNAFDSTTNYRFQPTVAGYYQINANQEVSPQTGVQSIIIYKTGTRIASGGSYASGSQTWMCSSSVLCYLNGSTDYIEAYIFTNQATTAYNGTSSMFSGSMVRAT